MAISIPTAPALPSVPSMAETLESALKTALYNMLDNVLVSPVLRWLAEHPVLGWLIAHPLWLAVLVGGVGVMLLGLFNAIARLGENFWVLLLRLPLWLLTWMFRQISQRLWGTRPIPPTPQPTERITELLTRLDALGAEQEILLAELKATVAEMPRSS